MTCRNGSHYECDKCGQRDYCMEYIPIKECAKRSINEIWNIYKMNGRMPDKGVVFFDSKYYGSKPILITWDDRRGTISIDGKEIDITYSSEFSFKANRDGVMSVDSPKMFVKEMIRCRVEDVADLDEFYYKALVYAKRVCKQSTKGE